MTPCLDTVFFALALLILFRILVLPPRFTLSRHPEERSEEGSQPCCRARIGTRSDVSDVKIYSLTSSRNVADGTKNKLPVTARL